MPCSCACSFSHCSSLVTLSLPTTLSEIGEQAFYNCSSLKSIVLPSAITTIAPFTFHNCTSLKSVTLGEKMESLCYNAFTNTNLDTITSYAVVPPLVYGVDGLYEIEGTDTVPAQQYDLFTVESQVCILRVYKESIAAYKANEAWGKFVNIMPISATGNAPSNNQLDNMFAVDGQLYLDGVGAYKVYDTTGQLIYEGSNPVLNLSKGIYIIVAGDQTKKIVL